jgi:hypothetical protein
MDVNRPRVQFTMGFKIPYDTGPQIQMSRCRCVLELRVHVQVTLLNNIKADQLGGVLLQGENYIEKSRQLKQLFFL